MTNKEAFKAEIAIDVSDKMLDYHLAIAGINGMAIFSVSDKSGLQIASLPLLQSLLSISSESEGGLSISYNIEGIKARIKALALKYNLATFLTQPAIRSKSVW